jgi:hypothetical protein
VVCYSFNSCLLNTLSSPYFPFCSLLHRWHWPVLYYCTVDGPIIGVYVVVQVVGSLWLLVLAWCWWAEGGQLHLRCLRALCRAFVAQHLATKRFNFIAGPPKQQTIACQC